MRLLDRWTVWVAGLGRQSRPRLMFLTVVLVLLIGIADYLSGYEILFSVFYLGPVIMATWFLGLRFALVIGAASVLSWYLGDIAAGARYTSRFVLAWNVVITLAFYLVMIGVVSSLRSLHDKLEAKVAERTAELTNEMAKRELLEKEILAIGERERRRIGHDLHDSLCQHLTGTALAGQVLCEKLAVRAVPEIVDAERVVALVEDGIALARSLARGLSPVEMEAEGLMAALKDLARATSERFRIQCRFEAPAPVLIEDASKATHLFRIAQEAISNAVKHGRAANVRIRLAQDDGAMVLSIRDDGCGMPQAAVSGRGMGLHIMRHRAAMIGASFEIQREIEGTTVACILPLPPPTQDLP